MYGEQLMFLVWHLIRRNIYHRKLGCSIAYGQIM